MLVCLVCCVMVRVWFWSLALHCIIHSPKNKSLLCSAKSVGLFLPFYLCIHVGHTLRGFPIFEPQRFAFLNSVFFSSLPFPGSLLPQNFLLQFWRSSCRDSCAGSYRFFSFLLFLLSSCPFYYLPFTTLRDKTATQTVPFCSVLFFVFCSLLFCPRS